MPAKESAIIRTCLIVSVLLLSGCASKLSVTYYSDPPGAVLYSGGQRLGYSPQTLYYPVSDEAKRDGFVNIPGTKAQWASGATAEIGALNADLKQYGFLQSFTFQRPDGAPGRETDERFALELARTQAMQRHAAAQEQQAAALYRQAAAQEARAAAAERSKHCKSTVNGNTVNTTCY